MIEEMHSIGDGTADEMSELGCHCGLSGFSGGQGHFENWLLLSCRSALVITCDDLAWFERGCESSLQLN